MKIESDNLSLFDLDEYSEEKPGRKTPESREEKRLKQIDGMFERDFMNIVRDLNTGKVLKPAEFKRLQEYKEHLEKRLGHDLPENIVNTQEDVGRYFERSRRTIIRWANAGMPVRSDGRYDLEDIEQWAIDQGKIIKEKEDPAAGDPEPTQAGDRHYRDRYWKSKAESQELRTALLRGDVVYRAEVIVEWNSRVGIVSKGLDSWSVRLPPLLVGQNQDEISRIIETEKNILKKSFAQDGKYTPTDPELV